MLSVIISGRTLRRFGDPIAQLVFQRAAVARQGVPDEDVGAILTWIQVATAPISRSIPRMFSARLRL